MPFYQKNSKREKLKIKLTHINLIREEIFHYFFNTNSFFATILDEEEAL
jgi:hypothetical protein